MHTQRPPAHCSPAGSVVSGSGGLRRKEAEKRAAAACTTDPATVIRPRAGPRGTATNLGSSRALPPHRFLRRAGCRRPRRCHGPGSPESRAPRVPAADSPLKDNGALSTLHGPASKSRGPANRHHTRLGGGTWLLRRALSLCLALQWVNKSSRGSRAKHRVTCYTAAIGRKKMTSREATAYKLLPVSLPI